jgi:hypothetical protein
LPICCLNQLLEKLFWFQSVPLGDLKEHFRIQRIPEELILPLSYHCLFVFLIPPVVRQEEVKSSCPGSPQGLREGLKLLKGVLVLLTKEDIDGFPFGAKS